MVVITWFLELVASVVGGADVGAGAVGGIIVPPPVSIRLGGTDGAIMAGYGYDKFAFLAGLNVVLVGPLRHLLAAVFQSFGGIVVGIARGVLEIVCLVYCHRGPCLGVLCHKVVGVVFAITKYQSVDIVAIETYHFDVAECFACWQGDGNVQICRIISGIGTGSDSQALWCVVECS